MALNAAPGSPIIPLNAPVLQAQGYGTTTAPPTTTTAAGPLATKPPQSTLPLPVILPLTVSIPPSAPLRRTKATTEPASPSPSTPTSSSVVRSVRPPTIPSIAVSPVATTHTTATAPVKPLSPQEVQQVEGMIERCLHLYMNQEEVIMALQIQANIAPTITRHVWQTMEGKSPEFFRAYEVRLKIKEQIMAFNYLVSQQAQVTEKSKNMTLDSGSFSAPSSSMALPFPFAPFNPLNGAGGYEPLPSPFAAPAPVFLPLTSSLSSLLTGVLPPSGILTASTDSALTLSTNSLINSFLKTSSDNLPSSSSSSTSSSSSSTATSSSSPPSSSSSSSSSSLSFAFGPPPAQLTPASTSSPTSLLASATATTASNNAPLLSSGSFAMPFISVENMDSPTTPFSPFALFSTQPIVTTTSLSATAESASGGGLFGTSATTNSGAAGGGGGGGGSTSSAMPIPNQSLLGADQSLRTSATGVSPMSTSPTPESFLTSSICSIPLTASTNALLDALSAGGTSPLRFSPLLTASTSSAPFNGSLEGLFPDIGAGGGSDVQEQQQRRAEQ